MATDTKGPPRVRAAERTRRARQSAAATAKTTGQRHDAQAEQQAQARAQAQAQAILAQAQQERAAAALAVVNLDEWIATPILVAFTEWESVTVPLWEGSQQTVTRQIPRRRTAQLSTFIPSEVELQALSILQESGLDHPADVADNTATNTGVAATAQTVATARRVVLLAWQCFEPDMTLDRLAKGITLEQTMALMQRFFSAMMRLGQQTATQAQDVASDSDSDIGASSAVSITAA